MKNIIFVCTGNTCRSPMAEGLFRKYLCERNLDFISVKSAGLAAAVGLPPSDNAVEAAAALGADISAHRSRALTQYDFSQDTYFVCMTSSHAMILRQYTKKEQILTLNVPDPYMGDLSVYMAAAEQITATFDTVFRFVFGCAPPRRMCLSDVESVAEIETACFAHPWTSAGLAEETENPTARFFVAESDGKPIAYIGANNIAGEVYITNIAVLPSYRKRGIGELLLSALLTASEKEQAEFVTLEVRKSNQAAIHLYEKLGFSKCGHRKGFYRDPDEDALIFTHNFH